LISNRFASLHELSTVYSIEDVYDMLEILNVDNHNQKIAIESRKKD